MMTSSSQAASTADAETVVRQVFAEVTRYPLEVLEPEADLEEDLGIDSVKLGEILSALQERYGFEGKLEIPLDQLRTLRSIARQIAALTAAAPAPATERTEPAAPAGPAGGNGAGAPVAVPRAPAGEELLERVRAIFAEVTRYPLEILEPDADLEEDLGIDSVKLGEILSVLAETFSLPRDLRLEPARLRTLSSLTTALAEHLAGGNGRPSAPHSAEAPATTPPPWLAEPAAASPAPAPLFTGKVALVTGSGRGLGEEIARHLAALGATVVINSFHSRQRGEEVAEEIRAAGGEALHLWGSVAKPEHLDGLFDRIEADFGGLDFYVANASDGMIGHLQDFEPAHWERGFRTNLLALHQGALRSLPLMRERGGGKILAISSPGAQRYVDYYGLMGPVKAAVETMVRYLAVELGPYGIQVNCLSAGAMYGDLLDRFPERDRLVAHWEAINPRRRLGTPRDVSNVVVQLLRPGSRLVNGSVVVVDSGGTLRV